MLFENVYSNYIVGQQYTPGIVANAEIGKVLQTSQMCKMYQKLNIFSGLVTPKPYLTHVHCGYLQSNAVKQGSESTLSGIFMYVSAA